MSSGTRLAALVGFTCLVIALVLGGFWLLSRTPKPAGTPAFLPPPAEPRLEPDVEGALRSRAEHQRLMLEQLDSILREAEALQRDVDALGDAHRENERLGRELERKLIELEQRERR